MQTSLRHVLDPAALEVQSFEISAQLLDLTGTDTRVDSRVAGCTEPIRACSG